MYEYTLILKKNSGRIQCEIRELEKERILTLGPPCISASSLSGIDGSGCLNGGLAAAISSPMVYTMILFSIIYIVGEK